MSWNSKEVYAGLTSWNYKWLRVKQRVQFNFLRRNQVEFTRVFKAAGELPFLKFNLLENSHSANEPHKAMQNTSLPVCTNLYDFFFSAMFMELQYVNTSSKQHLLWHLLCCVVLIYIFLKSFFMSLIHFAKALYPGQGHARSRSDPRNTGCETGTHPGWDERHYEHMHSHVGAI